MDRGVPFEETRYGRSFGEEAYRPVFNEVRQEFYNKGCEALTQYGARCEAGAQADPRISMAYDLLGSDIDGAIATLDDMGL
jgi:hypothetical protein